MSKKQLDTSHIIPFPLPDYLAQFISSQLKSPIEIIDDHIYAKAMHIRANRPLGKFILRCLEESEKPTMVKKGITMYIKVSQNIRINDRKCVEARGTFLTLSTDAIKDITDLFEAQLKTALIEFVDGVIVGNEFKKGKRNKAILKFFEKYNIDFTETAYERFKKLYGRETKVNKLSKNMIYKYL